MKCCAKCGLSNAKVLYMHSLANHFLENARQIRQWPRMEDDAIIAELTTIKGIGRWTAEMFLIFALGRPDVFPIDDLGLRQRHSSPLQRWRKTNEAGSVGDRRSIWRPYRSVGTWYMWRVLDPVPVAY